MGVNRLLLVRHGENRANLTKEFSHRSVDYPLTAKGRLQARQTAEYLRAFPVKQVFSSPLKRAHETAGMIAAEVGDEVSVLEHFREVDVGDLEGSPPTDAAWKRHDDIIGAWWQGDVHQRFPGGENFLELCERTAEGYKLMCRGREDETLVLAAHGGSIGLPLMRRFPELTRKMMRRHPNCAITELEASFENDTLQLKFVRWASVEHLYGEAAEFVSATPSEGDLE